MAITNYKLSARNCMQQFFIAFTIFIDFISK